MKNRQFGKKKKCEQVQNYRPGGSKVAVLGEETSATN